VNSQIQNLKIFNNDLLIDIWDVYQNEIDSIIVEGSDSRRWVYNFDFNNNKAHCSYALTTSSNYITEEYTKTHYLSNRLTTDSIKKLAYGFGYFGELETVLIKKTIIYNGLKIDKIIYDFILKRPAYFRDENGSIHDFFKEEKFEEIYEYEYEAKYGFPCKIKKRTNYPNTTHDVTYHVSYY
jgi:hypothetical protein